MRETGTLPKNRADAKMRRWTDGRSASQTSGKTGVEMGIEWKSVWGLL